MNAIRLTMFGLLLVAAITLRHVVFADQYTIGGNAAGSQNSIDVTGGQSTNVGQNNQGSFNNDINAGADTGGNSGGSITTGDASVNVTVDNRFNSNQANVTCCPDGKPSPTPTLKPGQSPSPTPTAGIGGPPGDGGDGDGDNGDGGAGGGGEVVGISAAAGENYTEIAITSLGIVCLLAGAFLTRKNHLAI